ncbi:SDR family NAD(P)-dependent oxidoreductase [Limobrevibacterium gyesilva]|uniref:SDR family oxidoreductase n=1 Tax=Limobrevibacterium gyesilva TaxID=2991712 RepID=A0AA41YNM8_9PROT|nr:SDR family oxidoreductase [Limobrevibacterium gyesilva]MCW3475856.1 SDR family oxidoreductase [Limobrevibacterium gyesilva]
MRGELAGRRVLVAGGAAGIGAATATLCDAEGAAVAVIDRSQCPGGLVADVRDTAAVDAAVAQASQDMGGIDGVIYCAGIDLMAPLEAMRDAEWERVLDVNLTGAMRVCRAALRHFPARGGTMVLVSSGAGLRPLPLRTAYAAAKAGLIMFAKVLAMELSERDIRVNALCPGAVDTALFRSSWEGAENPQAELEMIRNRYALRRIAEPEEIARCAVFLTGAQSSYVTGTALAVDGGRTFH